MKIEGKKKLWAKYQKEIADNDYYYARSCIRQNFFPGSESTFLRILRDELHKNILDDPRHTTCTGIAYHTDLVPLETTMTVVARQFALMHEAGLENYVASCVTSFGIYTEILDMWEHQPELEAKAHELLYKATKREFVKPKNLVHTSDIIYKYRDDIAQKAAYRLINKETGEPLKVVEHIGCHYAKMFPHKGVGGAEYPHVLSGMIESWGGDIIDYPERRHCCGFGFRQYLVKANRGYSVTASKTKFESMEPYKPDLILSNCPGCTYFMDRWQYVIAEMEEKTYDDKGQGIPSLTYEELAGLVMGYDPWDLGLQLHQVNVEPLLQKIGVEYDPNKKFFSKDGRDLGKPEKPEVLIF